MSYVGLLCFFLAKVVKLVENLILAANTRGGVQEANCKILIKSFYS